MVINHLLTGMILQVGNTSEPTIDFQGTFVRFQGSTMIQEISLESFVFSISKFLLSQLYQASRGRLCGFICYVLIFFTPTLFLGLISPIVLGLNNIHSFHGFWGPKLV